MYETEQKPEQRVSTKNILVAGAGIFGLWQTLMLARAGHKVQLVEASEVPFAAAQSRFAGAMLAPGCESVESEPSVIAQGARSLELWRQTYPALTVAGSLVVAAARDQSDLRDFARKVARAGAGYEEVDAERLALLEPDLANRFGGGLYFPAEAHMTTPDVLSFLLGACRKAGADVVLGARWSGDTASFDHVVDCRGLAARADLPRLRAVRGERLLIRSRDVRLTRPVRLLHPRHPLYVVPWSDDRYLVGATVIESEDEGPVTLRSALELTGLAYALHPAFAEAEILELGAGVRPSFPDNMPDVTVDGRVLRVNGAYRHGFLMAPVLAERVLAVIGPSAV